MRSLIISVSSLASSDIRKSSGPYSLPAAYKCCGEIDLTDTT
jgi:hypothetical protein